MDYSLDQPFFTVNQVAKHLTLTYPRANQLVKQLMEAGVLSSYGNHVYDRRFGCPEVLAVLLRSG